MRRSVNRKAEELANRDASDGWTRRAAQQMPTVCLTVLVACFVLYRLVPVAEPFIGFHFVNAFVAAAACATTCAVFAHPVLTKCWRWVCEPPAPSV